MDYNEFYCQLKKGIKEIQKHGITYKYVCMSQNTWDSLSDLFPTATKVLADKNSMCRLFGSLVCIYDIMPDGTAYFTNDYPFIDK